MPRYLTNYSLLALLLTVATCLGCSHHPPTDTSVEDPAATTVAADNEHCPIMGHEVTADGGRVEWNGKTIGFCCPGCIEKFEALSDDEKAAALAKADEEHEDHDHGKPDGDASGAS